MTRLFEIQDELTVARNFVECAFMACHELETEEADPLCAVLDVAPTKLKEIGEAIGAIKGDEIAAAHEHRHRSIRAFSGRRRPRQPTRNDGGILSFVGDAGRYHSSNRESRYQRAAVVLSTVGCEWRKNQRNHVTTT